MKWGMWTKCLTRSITMNPFCLKWRGHCIFGFVKWDLSRMLPPSINHCLFRRLHCKYFTLSLTPLTGVTFNTLCSYSMSLTSLTWMITFLFISVLLRSLPIQTGRVMVHSYTGGPRDMALWTRQSVVARSQPSPHDELETWKEMVLVPTLSRYSPNNIYNGDETALLYKLLPHRTYCFDGDNKPAGSAKCKDRLTLLIITNMDGSNHRKLLVIGKSKTPRCLQKKYKMQVKDMSFDWYALKNA